MEPPHQNPHRDTQIERNATNNTDPHLFRHASQIPKERGGWETDDVGKSPSKHGDDKAWEERKCLACVTYCFLNATRSAWETFEKLTGCHVGDKADGLSKLKQCFSSASAVANFTDDFDDGTSEMNSGRKLRRSGALLVFPRATKLLPP
ncbi:hypothetical protein YC2023_019550 [Brassica napus]